MENKFLERVGQLQAELKAPKGQTNKFGGYKYRSCEDILEAVKPLLQKHRLVLTVGDELMNCGDRYYVCATATLREEIPWSPSVWRWTGTLRTSRPARKPSTG